MERSSAHTPTVEAPFQGWDSLGCLAVDHLRAGVWLYSRLGSSQPELFDGRELVRSPPHPGFPISYQPTLFPPLSLIFSSSLHLFTLHSQILTFSVTGWNGLQDQACGPQRNSDLPGPVAEQGLGTGIEELKRGS